MTNEEIEAKVADIVRVWLDQPERIGMDGMGRPSVPGVLDAIRKVLEQGR